MSWNEDQTWESEWWGNCGNTFNEEEKQIVYANRMGLKELKSDKTPYIFDLEGSALDIGGGPSSLLLKCPNAKGTVVDPLHYPLWVYARYDACGIKYKKIAGEDINTTQTYDTVLIYNVLQHVIDPELIIKKALLISKEVRIFEWIDRGVLKGHPHNLTANNLNEWLHGWGKTENMNGHGCYGMAYYGVFLGRNYDR